MKKTFLINTPISISYLGFLLYLAFSLEVIQYRYNFADFIGNLSPFFLFAIFLQILLWSKEKFRPFTVKRLLTLTTLFFINFYLLFNYHLSKILVGYFNIEAIGWILNILAVISGFILLAQAILFLALYLIRPTRLNVTKAKNNKKE